MGCLGTFWLSCCVPPADALGVIFSVGALINPPLVIYEFSRTIGFDKDRFDSWADAWHPHCSGVMMARARTGPGRAAAAAAASDPTLREPIHTSVVGFHMSTRSSTESTLSGRRPAALTAAPDPITAALSPTRPCSSTKPKRAKKFKLGDRVTVEGYGVPGTVRFLGKHAETGGKRVGVELDDAIGKNTGTVGGHQYFQCPAKHGVLTLPKKVTPAENNEDKGPSSYYGFGEEACEEA